MTINYARESVIDFTKPFMNLGIGILFKVSRTSFSLRLLPLHFVLLNCEASLLSKQPDHHIHLISLCMYDTLNHQTNKKIEKKKEL